VAKIYISSTYEDLKEYRESVYDSLRKMRHDVISMEDYVAQDQRPLQKCLQDVASCDIYIGIFAWRYGFIPQDEKDNPDKLSITELEYRKAKENGIPCLIFLLDMEEWPLRFSDGSPQSGTKGDNIMRLRNELKNEYITSFFENPDQLASLVTISVGNAINEKNKVLEDNKEKERKSLLESRKSYYSWIINDFDELETIDKKRPTSYFIKNRSIELKIEDKFKQKNYWNITDLEAEEICKNKREWKIEDFLNSDEPIELVAAPFGIGKTTFAKHITKDIVTKNLLKQSKKEDTWNPIYISLNKNINSIYRQGVDFIQDLNGD